MKKKARGMTVREARKSVEEMTRLVTELEKVNSDAFLEIRELKNELAGKLQELNLLRHRDHEQRAAIEALSAPVNPEWKLRYERLCVNVAPFLADYLAENLEVIGEAKE